VVQSVEDRMRDNAAGAVETMPLLCCNGTEEFRGGSGRPGPKDEWGRP
jgi:hypothetical protein